MISRPQALLWRAAPLAIALGLGWALAGGGIARADGEISVAVADPDDRAFPELTLVITADRAGRPWDNADRRPSHADRRRSIRREMLEKQFHTTLPEAADDPKIQSLIETYLSLCL